MFTNFFFVHFSFLQNKEDYDFFLERSRFENMLLKLNGETITAQENNGFLKYDLLLLIMKLLHQIIKFSEENRAQVKKLMMDINDSIEDLLLCNLPLLKTCFFYFLPPQFIALKKRGRSYKIIFVFYHFCCGK